MYFDDNDFQSLVKNSGQAPVFLERSDEEKKANARLLNNKADKEAESRFWVRWRRRAEGMIIITVVYLVIGCLFYWG